MGKLIIDGEAVGGSTNYASAIEYIEENGNKTTVQDKISELNFNLGEDVNGMTVHEKLDKILSSANKGTFDCSDGSTTLIANTSYTENIAFAHEFEKVPTITCILKSTSIYFSYDISNVTTTGFTLTISRTQGSDSYPAWHWYARVQ